MAIEEKIRGFITTQIIRDGSRAEVTNDYPLISSHTVDSLGIFQLVSFLESEFGIEVLDEELVPDHFQSINEIARYVHSKL